jgi:twitching motility protein PilT
MAETGHLVFATLHTNDAAQAVDRIIDVFPDWRQDQIRVQLSASLAAIIAQRLVPRVGGGRVAAFEVLIANHPVRNLIREGKSNQLLNIMTTNQQEGMCTLESSLAAMVNRDIITYEDALEVSVHPKELDRALNKYAQMAAAAAPGQPMSAASSD